MVNKQSWMYAGKLKRHKLELAHWPQTGKVYIRLNDMPLYESEMLASDADKTFQFFVDDELCIVRIEKRGNKFAYQFTSPEYSTSRTAKWRKWKDILLMVAIAGVFTLVIGGLGVPFVYNLVHTQKLNNNLDLGGIITTAYLNVQPDMELLPNKPITLSYKFKAGLHLVSSQFTIPAADSSLLALHSLFPVSGKSSFQVLYSSSDPKINRLLYNQPSEAQIEQYRQEARKVCLQKQFPELSPDADKLIFCDCLITYLYTHHEVVGMAQLYYANQTAVQNPRFNENTFAQFMQQDLQTEIKKICTKAASKTR